MSELVQILTSAPQNCKCNEFGGGIVTAIFRPYPLIYGDCTPLYGALCPHAHVTVHSIDECGLLLHHTIKLMKFCIYTRPLVNNYKGELRQQ